MASHGTSGHDQKDESSAGPSFQSDAPTTIQRSVEANNAEWNAAFYLVQRNIR